MKKIIQVGIVIGGFVIFFVVCNFLKLSYEQMGRLVAEITIPLIALLLGFEFWKKFKAKERKKNEIL